MRRHLASMWALLGLVCFVTPAAVHSQSTDPLTLSGQVTSNGVPLQDAHVTIDGTVLRAVTDEQGHYRLRGLSPGRHAVTVRAIGYKSEERAFEVTAQSGAVLDFELEVAAIELDRIMVTGTLKEAFLSESPVTVKVVPIEALERKLTVNLVESLQQVNGLYEQVDCAVCGTNNIRINGLEGTNTAFLIDGMPIMGSLASVYGLNGIHPAIVEQVEVLKGPSSTLYGSEALAGVINVITKDPRFTPRFSLNTYVTSHKEFSGDIAVAGGTNRTHALLSGSLTYSNHFLDHIQDGFADVPKGTRAYFFGKIDRYGTAQKRFGLAAKYYYEDRLGGVKAFRRSLRGSQDVYGESIYTNRFELVGSYRLPFDGEHLNTQFSYAYHDQDSFYGDVKYAANQHVGYLNLLWDGQIGARNDFLLGAALHYESYDDNTPATPTADKRFVPGVFVQDELRASESLSLLGGLRADHHRDHGMILSPRVAIKWELARSTTLRLNAGTGFRVIQLFTEDHAAFTGQREVVIEGNLDPERTKNATLNLSQILRIGHTAMMLDLDVFYTYFNNRIVHDYDLDPGEIHYYNVDGHAVSRGIGFGLNHNLDEFPLNYSLGLTVQDVYNVHEGVRKKEHFSADWMAVWSASYIFGGRVTVDYTGKAVGPMRMPAYDAPFEKPTRSPAHAVHNLQASMSVNRNMDIYFGVKNLFNYTQSSPLTDPAHPFGDLFDTTYVYGPLEGRRAMFGLRLALGR